MSFKSEQKHLSHSPTKWTFWGKLSANPVSDSICRSLLCRFSLQMMSPEHYKLHFCTVGRIGEAFIIFSTRESYYATNRSDDVSEEGREKVRKQEKTLNKWLCLLLWPLNSAINLAVWGFSLFCSVTKFGYVTMITNILLRGLAFLLDTSTLCRNIISSHSDFKWP